MEKNDTALTEFSGSRVRTSGVSCCVCVNCICKVCEKNLNLSLELPSVVGCCTVSCSSQDAENYCAGYLTSMVTLPSTGHKALSSWLKKITFSENHYWCYQFLWARFSTTPHCQETVTVKFCQHYYHYSLWSSRSTIKALLIRCISVRVQRSDHLTD